jgi:hypothetical protein
LPQVVAGGRYAALDVTTASQPLRSRRHWSAFDRILYDKASGNIFYDADGGGGSAAVLFARVTAGTELTHLDSARICRAGLTLPAHEVLPWSRATGRSGTVSPASSLTCLVVALQRFLPD